MCHGVVKPKGLPFLTSSLLRGICCVASFSSEVRGGKADLHSSCECLFLGFILGRGYLESWPALIGDALAAALVPPPPLVCLLLDLTQREQDESTQTGELQRRSNDVYEDDDDFIGRHMCALGCAELGDNGKG